MTIKRVIIDTDPGIDDTAAIFLALASPELHVEALTTVYGNGSIADCTRNALIILETAGRSDIPVYQGAGKPLMGAPNYGAHVHGSDALGDVGVPPPVGVPQARHQEYHVRIATHDALTRGQTVVDVMHRWHARPNAKVLMGVQAERLTDMFTTRVLGYVRPA